MNSIFSGFLKFRSKNYLPYLSKKFSINVDFSGEEDIVENYLGNVKLIGINMLETKNKLTESALDKLLYSLKNFYSNDELLVAVLHGCGGNFCTGVVKSEEAFKKCEEIIELLINRDKPLVASLKGNIANFGFQMAVMCDLRVVEENSFLGFKLNSNEIKTPDVVYKRLMSCVGVTQTALLLLTNTPWSSAQAMNNGFVNAISPCGCSLGQAVVYAQSIGLSSLSEVVQKKRALNTWANEILKT